MSVPADPSGTDPQEVTQLLAAVRDGDPGAAERLFSAVYGDLKRIARRQLGGGDSATITPTVLVHEAYLRLARPGNLEQQDRTHFFAVAARAMRQIVIDHARERSAEKRGGVELARVELDDDRVAAAGGRELDAAGLLALDTALHRLERDEPRLAEVVEWRFFGGLSLEEIADLRGLSARTLKRDWRRARAILYAELFGGGANAPVEI